MGYQEARRRMILEAPLTKKERAALNKSLRISKQPFEHKYPKDIVGFRFGKLVILSEIIANGPDKILYGCICDCGNNTQAMRSDLINGRVTSCSDCSRKEKK